MQLCAMAASHRRSEPRTRWTVVGSDLRDRLILKSLAASRVGTDVGWSHSRDRVVDNLCSRSPGSQALQQLVKTDPVDRAVLLARSMRIEEVFSVRGDVLSPAMRGAVIDLRS